MKKICYILIIISQLLRIQSCLKFSCKQRNSTNLFTKAIMDAMVKELFFLSVKRGYNDVIRILVKYGWDSNVENEQDKIPPRLANFKRPSLTKLFIDSGANVNLFDEEGNSPLHIAAKSGNVKSVQLLLAAGANINSKNMQRETALHLAVANNHKDVMNLLLHKGAAVNVSCIESALCIAASNKNSTLIKTLLKYRADLHFVNDNDGYTPLHKLVWVTDKRLIKLILRHTVDVDHQNDQGMTALAMAVSCNNLIFVEMLLDHGAQVNLEDEGGETPLHHATQNNSYDIIKILLDRGSNPNIKSLDGVTPLLNAAQYLNVSAVKLLLKYGADINAKDDNHDSILHFAARNRNVDVIKFIVDTLGIDVNLTSDSQKAFYCASEKNILPNCFYLLDRGFNVHTKSENGETLLSRTSYPALSEIGKMLLLEHMAKQQSIGITVNEFDKEVIAKNKKYQQYFDLCTQELEKMKATIVYNDISFHAILTGSNKILSGYAKNSRIRQIATDSEIEKMFPIYHKIMRFRFDPEVTKQNMIQKATDFLGNLFKNHDPFNIVSTEVVKYLNNKDLTLLMC